MAMNPESSSVTKITPVFPIASLRASPKSRIKPNDARLAEADVIKLMLLREELLNETRMSLNSSDSSLHRIKCIIPRLRGVTLELLERLSASRILHGEHLGEILKGIKEASSSIIESMAKRGLSFAGPLFVPIKLRNKTGERQDVDCEAVFVPPLPPELYTRCVAASAFVDRELQWYEAEEREDLVEKARAQPSQEEEAALAERQLRLLLERGNNLSTELRSRQQRATHSRPAVGLRPNKSAYDRLLQKFLNDSREAESKNSPSKASELSLNDDPDSPSASLASPTSRDRSIKGQAEEDEEEDEDELSESSAGEEEHMQRLPAAFSSGQEILVTFIRSLISEVRQGREGARLYTASRCIQQAARSRQARRLVQELKGDLVSTSDSYPDSPLSRCTDPYNKRLMAVIKIQGAWRGAIARIALVIVSQLKRDELLAKKTIDSRLALSEAGSQAAKKAANDAAEVYEKLSERFGMKRRLLPVETKLVLRTSPRPLA